MLIVLSILIQMHLHTYITCKWIELSNKVLNRNIIKIQLMPQIPDMFLNDLPPNLSESTAWLEVH